MFYKTCALRHKNTASMSKAGFVWDDIHNKTGF